MADAFPGIKAEDVVNVCDEWRNYSSSSKVEYDGERIDAHWTEVLAEKAPSGWLKYLVLCKLKSALSFMIIIFEIEQGYRCFSSVKYLGLRNFF